MAWVGKLGAALVLAMLASAGAAQAQDPPADSANANTNEAGLEATTAKFNAYVEFMNRTLRAVQSIDRYKSWVNMKTGPTGHESIIYGLYSVYDTTREAAAATAALTQEPLLPELDSAMRDYIAANAALGPILNEASAYYERKDYKDDKMGGGKALHARIVAAAEPFLATRARLDNIVTAEKAKVDAARLASIEKREGRKANWHVANVMMRAQHVMDLLPSTAKPVIDVAPFDAAILDYSAAVKDMDTYGASNPNAFFVFESQPRSLLGKLRDFQEKIDRAKGDARRAGGGDLTWIVNDYNTMVTTSQNATQFNH
ncbi:YiiG family protein [Methylocapsa sp. S129]|uniref:YiiG family protein n=1 Tax=Methylocapsa sp. S129 TaxID=1641869 RepID=UPI001576AC2A|nr:YiiG family protein [Methylocapsa sp. S129]